MNHAPPMSNTMPGRLLTASGALLAGIAVALAAYGSHAVQGEGQRRLLLAAVFALAHGIALASLAPAARRKVGRIALALLLIGTLLFSGSLVAAHFFGAPTRLAPAGGSLMIAAWLLYAVDVLRR